MPSVIHNIGYFLIKASKYLRESKNLTLSESRIRRAEYASACLESFGIEVTGPTPEEISSLPPCIFTANHASTLDALIIVSLFSGDLRILAKDSLYKVPELGRILRMEKHIIVHRGKKSSERNASIRTDIQSAIEAGGSVLIFPEGTRTRDGKLGEFKHGAFYNAIQSNVPIVPLIIRGTFESMPKTTLRIKPGKCSLQILSPIQPPPESSGDEKQRAEMMCNITRDIMKKALESN